MPGFTKGERYYTSTAVFLGELVKLVISLCIDVGERGLHDVVNNTFGKDHFKLALPAVLYAVQNNLQYVAISNLSAATFQVLHQTKIISTGIFSVILLRRILTRMQWVSLLMLTTGAALTQVPTSNIFRRRPSMVEGKRHTGIVAADMNMLVGTAAVLGACMISGLSGVYFEKVLKSNTAGLWTRNVQLATYSLIPAFLLGVVVKDGPEIARDGFFWGYNWVVWLNIISQSVGGLVVALAVKYADNIAKNFATAMSILISFVASVYFFDFVITSNFVVGSVLAVTASYVYSVNAPKTHTLPPDEKYKAKLHHYV